MILNTVLFVFKIKTNTFRVNLRLTDIYMIQIQISTYINVSDTCCDTLHDTHYIIINPNYYKYIYLFIMFGTRYDFDMYT